VRTALGSVRRRISLKLKRSCRAGKAGLAGEGICMVAASGRHRLIVDSQVHIWKARTPDRPWPLGGARPSSRAVQLR
jgi:hypothetical protein